MRIFLVRHGESMNNANKDANKGEKNSTYFDSRSPDPELSDKGK